MAITPLGVVGAASGFGVASLNVPFTSSVPVSTPAIASHVIVCLHRSGELATLSAIYDDAPAPLDPFACYSGNQWGAVGGIVSAGDGEAQTFMGLVLSALVGGANSLNLVFTGTLTYVRAVLLAYTGIHDDYSGGTDSYPGVVDSTAWSTVPPVGMCYLESWTPAASDRIVLGFIESDTPGVTSLTWADGTTTGRDVQVDQSTLHLSGEWGERASSGGAEQIGGCTDVLAGADTQIGGVALALAAGVGPTACSSPGPPAGKRKCCGSRCQCSTLQLASGGTFTIQDSSGASIFEVRDDGTVHIKTGQTVQADL